MYYSLVSNKLLTTEISTTEFELVKQIGPYAPAYWSLLFVSFVVRGEEGGRPWSEGDLAVVTSSVW